MQYIVLDMEWNQAWPGSSAARKGLPLHGEIIQIGAVRVLEDRTVADEFQIQPGADQGRVIGIAQGVMGRAARFNVQKLHGRAEGPLVGAAVGLGVEDHLGVVPPQNPV